jgi:hypothetical protein
MKLINNFKLVAVILITLLALIKMTSTVSLRKVESDAALEAERHKTAHKSQTKHKTHTHSSARARNNFKAGVNAESQVEVSQPTPPPKYNATNITLSSIMYNDLNNSFVKQDMPTFRLNNRRYADLKLDDKQLEDIYQDLIYKQNKDLTPEASRAAIQIFVNNFENCDTNKDNVLSPTEFTGCMKNDTYLNMITPPQPRFATFANYSFTNNTGFFPILFNLMDTNNFNYTNFHDYMMLRLMVFSWRKCSVNGPFIEEVSFECAIEIAFGSKTLSRNTARHLYKLALELSNSQSVRNLDFISYFIMAQGVRLFGKINGKEDGDGTKTEFDMALDSNMLPSRYSQEIINHLFQLVEEPGKANQGIDLLSFVFYDFILRLFEVPNSKKKWYLAPDEFTGLFNHYLFPATTLEEVKSIPQNNLTSASYQMYTYLNISLYHQEADHFLKFTQKSEKISTSASTLSTVSNTKNAVKKNRITLGNKMKALAPPGNQTFDLASTSSWLFKILDNDGDGFLSFYDYANFMQIAYLFNRFDPYRKGRIVSGNIFEKYTSYADFPYVSYSLRDRSKRFNLFPQDLYIDLMRAVLVLRIDDIINANKRRVDPTTLYEVELKGIFASVNLGAVPDAYLNKCLRGVDDNNIPKYDWECAFVQAVTSTLNFLESSAFYLTAKQGNLALTNTAFVNIDPEIF